MLDTVVRTLAHVLTPLFVAGMAGATVVVLITVMRDVVQFVTGSAETTSSQD